APPAVDPVNPLPFDEYLPPRDLPAPVNIVPGAIAIQNKIERLDWAQQSGDPIAYAPHLRKAPLTGRAHALLPRPRRLRPTQPRPGARVAGPDQPQRHTTVLRPARPGVHRHLPRQRRHHHAQPRHRPRPRVPQPILRNPVRRAAPLTDLERS